MRVQLQRQARVFVTDPRCDHNDRHALQMHQRGARVARCVQLDLPHTGCFRGVAPIAGQHLRVIRLTRLIADDVLRRAAAER
jgi:hypothetical protein